MIAALVAVALATPAVPTHLAPSLKEWRDVFGINAKVVVEKCGYENAWYSSTSRTVTLCSELLDRPALTRFILNHEMAHAYFHQRHVPVVDEEMEADELAYFMSDDDEVHAGVLWFLSEPSDGKTQPGEHPSHLDRAGMLLCLDDGFSPDPASRACKIYARSALAAWLRTADLVE